MPRLIIAAAQYHAVAADIERNLNHHLRFIRQAAAQHVQLLIFPELSLTGYELNAASRLALTLDDPRLQPLADAAKQQQMTLVVGAPLNDGTELFIGALTFRPTATEMPTPNNICTVRKRDILSRQWRRTVDGEPTTDRPGDLR